MAAVECDDVAPSPRLLREREVGGESTLVRG